MNRSFALFETPIGSCAIVWNGRGIAGLQLPERDETETRARTYRRFQGVHEAEPDDRAARVIAAIGELLSGGAADLSSVPLDMDGVPAFHRRVYELARRIRPGRTMTYGDIAVRLGAPGSARAVGQALGRNPFAIIVPCHRVVAAGGRMGGFSASGGVATKLRLLALENGSLV